MEPLGELTIPSPFFSQAVGGLVYVGFVNGPCVQYPLHLVNRGERPLDLLWDLLELWFLDETPFEDQLASDLRGYEKH